MTSSVAVDAQPYVGPRPFETRERGLFFGRDREAHEVSSLILANKLLVLYAASGAGKTSLINAGVQPLIEDELEILPTARLHSAAVSLRLSDVANVYTYTALAGWAKPRNLGKLGQATLAEFLATRPRQTDQMKMPKSRLVVFDQFEELFTTHPDRWRDREAFLLQLAHACDTQRDLRVLIAIRDDFLSRLLGFSRILPGGLKDRYALEPLRKPSAELAIVGPAEQTGRSFEPAAVNDLVQRLVTSRVDVGDSRSLEVEGEFIEPVLLQVVCRALWAALPPEVTTITTAHISELADVDSSLARFYSDAVRGAAEHGRVTERRVREWVQQKLITVAGTRGNVFVGAKTTEGLPNEVVHVLEGQLLRAEFRAGARWLEITHDSLLRPIEQSNLDFFRTVDTAQPNEALITEANYLLGKADQHLTEGDLDAALATGMNAYHIFGHADDQWGEANSLLLLGDIHRVAEEREAAIEAYSQSATLFEQYGDEYRLVHVLSAAGDLLNDAGEYEGAVRTFSRALDHLPRTQAATLYAARGTALWYDDRLNAAATDFTTALEIDPNDIATLANRAHVLTEIGQSDSALRDLDEVIRSSTDSNLVAYAYSARGYALANLDRNVDAMASFNQSLRAAPRNAWTYWRRSRVLAQQGRQGEAVRDATTALEMDDPGLTPKLRSQVEKWLRQQRSLS